jgi:hypothetical protein
MTTLERLEAKIQDDSVRMPSIDQISKMLTEYGVIYDVRQTTNVVEYRSAGNRYVNSRHDGKVGKKLIIENRAENVYIELDTSDSYYSWNTRLYARQIVEYLRKKKKIK